MSEADGNLRRDTLEMAELKAPPTTTVEAAGPPSCVMKDISIASRVPYLSSRTTVEAVGAPHPTDVRLSRVNRQSE